MRRRVAGDDRRRAIAAYDVSRVSSGVADANGVAIRRTVAGSPAITTYSWLRVCDTVPTFSPAGLWMPIRAPTYRRESKARATTSPRSGAHLAQLVERHPRLVVVRHDHDVGVDRGDRAAQRVRHLALAVEHALGRIVAGVDALAGHAVVLRLVPRHERLPHVVVGEVAVLVVRRVEVGEVDMADRCRRVASASPSSARPGPASRCGTSRRSGLYERGAHSLTYAICTPVVESTRSAASSRLVSRIGSSGGAGVVAGDRLADGVDPLAVVRLEEPRSDAERLGEVARDAGQGVELVDRRCERAPDRPAAASVSIHVRANTCE